MPGTSDLNQADPIVGIVNDSITSVTASDLRENRSQQFVDVVRTACRETGFFCIQPDPEQRTIIARTLHRMQQFFAIDDKDPRKQEVRQDDSEDLSAHFEVGKYKVEVKATTTDEARLEQRVLRR